jgi:hypothetical protein
MPGEAGAEWTAEEISQVKKKLYAIFAPNGGAKALRELYDNSIPYTLAQATPTAPKFVRLSFHDCLKYNDTSGMGCDGCISMDGVGLRYSTANSFAYDADTTLTNHNNALRPTLEVLEGIYTNADFPKIAGVQMATSLRCSGKSRADLWSLAAIAGVEWGVDANNLYCDAAESAQDAVGTPTVQSLVGKSCQYGLKDDWEQEDYCKTTLSTNLQFYTGRKDCVTDSSIALYYADSSKHEVGPDPEADGERTYSWFEQNFGLGKRETAALMGAHTFGRITWSHSLYRYGWTSRNMLLWNNQYYRAMTLKPDYIYDSSTWCPRRGDAFGSKGDVILTPVAWLDEADGGAVQWLTERYSCIDCDDSSNTDNECCIDVPEGQQCNADNGRTSSSNEDDDKYSGCEQYRLISGIDETMLQSDLGIYLNFTTDDHGTPTGCSGVDGSFEEYGFYPENWVNRKKRKMRGSEPTCPFNFAADPGDSPVNGIIDSYAEDPAAWMADFVPAYEKMMSNGYGTSELVAAPEQSEEVTITNQAH